MKSTAEYTKQPTVGTIKKTRMLVQIAKLAAVATVRFPLRRLFMSWISVKFPF